MEGDARFRGVYRLPDSLAEDLERFRRMTSQFKQGGVSAAQFQVFRVPQGVYEQRESGTFMLRVRLPAGVLLPRQMRRLAEVATTYGNGILHITTRQDVQVHHVALDSIHPALVALAEVGLSTKGGGGNTVRNITACQDAGVCPTEVFDVTPYAVALTDFLLADPVSYQLPRKYKIAFSGCSKDCPGATVNDLGLIAKRRDGLKGFAVYVGGGMGARSRVAEPLEMFVPASEVFLMAEAVKRVFDRHGNRKNKHRARLRFLIERIGFEAFRGLCEKELAELRETPPACPDIQPLPHPKRAPACPKRPAAGPAKRAPGLADWRKSNVVPQKQAGYTLVRIPLFLGDVEAETLHALADVVEHYGEGMLRTTQWQNVALRWVHENELAELRAGLADLGLAASCAPVVQDLVACAGASTCKLGICLSRGLAKALADALVQSDLELNALGDLKVQISGCPNACGRHPVAQVGFFGAARRVKGRLVPHYVAQLGGRVQEGKTQLAQGRRTIPARNVPAFLVDLLQTFEESARFPDFFAFLGAGGARAAEKLAREYGDVPSFQEDKNFYFDWGADKVFSLAGRGPGECGAGVFDLIEVDLASAAEALDEGRFVGAAVLAARALLVTRGEEAANDAEALNLFRKHFLVQGLVDARLEPVIVSALRSVSTPDPETAFDGKSADVAALVEAVKNLYDSMDPSLRFTVPQGRGHAAEPPSAAEPTADLTRDFRGVACPLNYVKTKLALGRIEDGQTLLVLLDEEGARNVPASAANEGHEVLCVTQEGNYWKVLLRKAKGGRSP